MMIYDMATLLAIMMVNVMAMLRRAGLMGRRPLKNTPLDWLTANRRRLLTLDEQIFVRTRRLQLKVHISSLSQRQTPDGCITE